MMRSLKNKTNVSGELMGNRKYIVVSPAKNEGKNLPRLIQSMAEQTIKPRVWVILDDGSKDGTPNIIRGAQEEHSWIQSVRLEEHPRDLGKHYAYVCNTGFNHAIKYCEAHDIPYEYVGIVDADMTLETELFEKLITEFERNPRLGVASGSIYSIINNELILENVRGDILLGSPKLWRKKCFEETGGGYLLTYSADAVSVVLAKLRGWEARRFEKINAIQARRTSSAEGLWNGYVINGISAYFLNFNTPYVLIKGLKYTFEKPYYIGIPYLYGYFTSFLRRLDKIDNKEVRDYFYYQKHKEIMRYYKNKLKWGKERYMKVAFVHPAHIDYRLELFSKLNEMCDIKFIFTKQGRGQGDVKEEHLKIPQEWSHKIIKSDKLEIRGRSIITYLKLIRELLRRDYDIVLTSTSRYICFPIAKITGKKFIFWTEFWYFPSNTFIRRLLNLSTRFIAKHADAIIATGTKAYKAYQGLGINRDKIFTYPQCAVDYSEIPAKDLRKELGLEGTSIILYVGRIVRMKGIDYLIKSFVLLEKELENVFLIIVGDGPFRKEYEKLAEELCLKNIIFTGYKGVDKAFYYKACDVFVLPSIFLDDQYEAWGLVINEAMAFGKPVVTTDAVGAADDLVKNGYNGYVVKNKDVKELYETLYKILSNPGLARKMGENSRKNFEMKNDYGQMVKTFVDAIKYVRE